MCSTHEVETIVKSIGNHGGHELGPNDVSVMIGRLDINDDGQVELWELCSYLLQRHDEIVDQRADIAVVDMAFELFIPEGHDCAGGAGADAKSGHQPRVGVGELRRIFTVSNACTAGLSEEEFQHLLTEFGVDSDGGSVPLSTLRNHPAFNDQCYRDNDREGFGLDAFAPLISATAHRRSSMLSPRRRPDDFSPR